MLAEFGRRGVGAGDLRFDVADQTPGDADRRGEVVDRGVQPTDAVGHLGQARLAVRLGRAQLTVERRQIGLDRRLGLAAEGAVGRDLAADVVHQRRGGVHAILDHRQVGRTQCSRLDPQAGDQGSDRPRCRLAGRDRRAQFGDALVECGDPGFQPTDLLVGCRQARGERRRELVGDLLQPRDAAAQRADTAICRLQRHLQCFQAGANGVRLAADLLEHRRAVVARRRQPLRQRGEVRVDDLPHLRCPGVAIGEAFRQCPGGRVQLLEPRADRDRPLGAHRVEFGPGHRQSVVHRRHAFGDADRNPVEHFG